MRVRLSASLALAAVTGGISAQQGVSWENLHGKTEIQGDTVEYVSASGFRYASGGRELRADAIVIRMDRDEWMQMWQPAKKGLPRRGTVLPDTRRSLSSTALTRRFEAFLASIGSPRPGTTDHEEWTKLFRSVYLEGNLVVIDQGVEMMTAKSLMFSIPDDRVVFKDAVMRLVSKSTTGPERVLVLRAPKLIKQGPRIVGRNVSLTTCVAGKPHFEVLSEQIEIRERAADFEVWSRGNNLAFSGRRTVPLPDAHFYTSEQSDIPLKSVRASYSSSQGVRLGVDFGASFNQLGGSMHNLLTGRSADEFRGEWRAGFDYIETRGTPMDGELKYRGGDLYFGRTKGFLFDGDRGPNQRFIQVDGAGNLITDRYRDLIHSENRVNLADNWRLDVTAFSASDEAVYSEFYLGEYQEAELPESSLHLRHADDNRLFTVTGRTNLAGFSYRDDRSLSPTFRNEEPMATYDLFSERLTTLGDVDVVLTSSTEAGWLRHEYDRNFASTVAPVADRTRRLDQLLEVAAPFVMGPFAIRPHASGRFTHYDNSISGREQERWALDAGISVTTRLARTFESTDAAGNTTKIRHAIYPQVSFGHLYQVDGRATDFHQFDEIDSLNEHGAIRVSVLQRFHESSSQPVAPRRNPFAIVEGARDSVWNKSTRKATEAREFLFVDLAQNFVPISDRDNQGELLGLSEYEFIWRPQPRWLPIENLSFLVEGEHDWKTDRARTFNSLVRFGEVLGMNWHAGYRTDYKVDGAAIYALSTSLFGRWTVLGMGAFDLQTDEQLYYSGMLVRRDHDWIVTMALTYDIIQRDTQFRIDFEPLFGGLTRSRSREFAGMSGYGADAILNR